MLVGCVIVLGSFQKPNLNDVIKVGDRLKPSTLSNINFLPFHTGSAWNWIGLPVNDSFIYSETCL